MYLLKNWEVHVHYIIIHLCLQTVQNKITTFSVFDYRVKLSTRLHI